MSRRKLVLLALLLMAAAAVPLAAQRDIPAGFQRRTLVHQGATRSYYIHFPPGYSSAKRYPVLILLHGGGGNALQALESYPVQSVTDRQGAILVAANGTGPLPRREALLTWNVAFGFGAALEKKVDDTGFLRQLILSLRDSESVDPKRVYLTGLSNGAIMCHRAGAANSDLVRGIAPVCGTVGGRDESGSQMLLPEKPTKPVDVVMFCGALDDSIPLEGGRQRRSADKTTKVVMSAEESAEFWVKANGCQPTPHVEELPQQKATRKTWKGGREGTQVVLYILHNQGHAWPGGAAPKRRVADQPSTLLKAHDVMWRFFTRP